jgi:hypothetical protein
MNVPYASGFCATCSLVPQIYYQHAAWFLKLKLSFEKTRPLCHMQLGSPCQVAEVEFRVVAAEVSTRDLVQEYLANRIFPTSSGWGMPKKKDGGKKHELVRLPYQFKFEKQFKKPCQELLEMIETMCNEILGNYTKKED